MMSGADPEAEL